MTTGNQAETSHIHHQATKHTKKIMKIGDCRSWYLGGLVMKLLLLLSWANGNKPIYLRRAS
jgi:hypothetical protein